MSVTRFSTSTVVQGMPKYTRLYDGATLLSSYESISTVTVGAGGASSVSFTSIPATYSHLQIRGILQTNRGTYGVDNLNLRFNSDTASNYSYHQLTGDGATTTAYSGATQTANNITAIGTITGASFGGIILDVLDYTNVSKYKTNRTLAGADLNGLVSGYGGVMALNSGLWMSTSAISSLTITPQVGTLFTQYSSFALYGIRG